MKRLKLFWTTQNPFNPCADWIEWLDLNCGKGHWHWVHYDVLAGDTDERTVFELVLPTEESALAFVLQNEHEIAHDYPRY